MNGPDLQNYKSKTFNFMDQVSCNMFWIEFKWIYFSIVGRAANQADVF